MSRCSRRTSSTRRTRTTLVNRTPLNAWAVYPRRNPSARLRLFCFPYAGGGATVFSTWWRGLPPEVEVVAVQPPGRESRLSEKPHHDLAELVAAMHRHLLPHLRELPFAFFGHSNGALMAFELVRSLRRAGDPLPLHLFVSGRPAPHLVLEDPPIHHLPHDEFVEELRRLKGTPEEILQNREILELLLPLLRADFSLGETYRFVPEAPLAFPLSAYGGERDVEVPREQVEAWSEQAGAGFRVRIFPGDHFFVNGDRDLVLAELSAELGPLLGRPAPHGA
jgi:medium-chain acyl-[acyl-carrier-protein] hydrolase